MVLRDRFVLERVLGEGGMGRVFLAIDREVDGPNVYVAIKVLAESFRDHPQALQGLRREATNARQLNHPNIVGVYHFDRDGAHVFMVMEYMRGQSLDGFIRANGAGISYERAWPIVEGCGHALAYMHAHHVIHADFKPGNVFLTDEQETKVLDLGIARTIDETLAVRGGTRFDPGALGALTPQYASCEMFERQTPDPRDDLYALGCVAFELLTGSHPFDGMPAIEARAKKLHPKRPRGLKPRSWRALERALAFERSERIFSADEFLKEFGPAPSKPNAVPWIGASAALVLTLGGVLYWTIEMRPSPDERFVAGLLAAGASSDPVTRDQAAFWIEQGENILSLARNAIAAGDLKRAFYFLQDGASSARWVYTLALTRAPGEDDRRRAAQGLLALSKAYLQGAEKLHQEGKLDESLQFVCEGLRLNRYEPAFKEWYDRLEGQVPSVEAIQRCVGIDAVIEGRDEPQGG